MARQMTLSEVTGLGWESSLGRHIGDLVLPQKRYLVLACVPLESPPEPDQFGGSARFSMSEAINREVAHAAASGKKSAMERILETVERVGNMVPHPAVIFILLIVPSSRFPTFPDKRQKCYSQ